MLRVFQALVWAFFLTSIVSVFGQQDSGVQVLKHEWKPNFRSPSLANQQMKEPQPVVFQEPTLIRNRDGSNSINPNSDRVNPDGTPDSTPTRLPAEKSIKAVLELKNNSTKKITSLVAYFIFYDRDKKEYLRYRLTSDKSIKPGETVKIKKNITRKDFDDFSNDAAAAAAFLVAPAASDVQIASIKFDDGSVWTAN